MKYEVRGKWKVVRKVWGRVASGLCLLMLCLLLVMPPALAAGPMVNMNVTDAEVRDVLTALASVGRVSIVADDSVTGKITIQLRNIPFETALDLVTKTKGLTYYKTGNVIVVASADKLSKGFGSVQIIKLKYARADEVKKSLALVIPDERLKVDEATNSLVFSGSPAESEALRQALAELDVPYEQVSLEAQVVAINRNAAKDLGFDWQWSGLPANTEFDSTSGTTKTTREYPGVIKFGKAYDGTPYEFTFQAKLSALITSGEAKLLAKPKITTINGKEAKILIGDRIPVLVERTENGKTTTTIEYIDAGIKLTYTPRINADGYITAAVHTEVSTPTLVPEMKAYRVTTREATTNVRMKDGDTMVIGGLISNEESGGKNRVPLLSDLPVLGKLFESVHKTKNETEVVIFLTARIVK
ncbi:type II and III secretion system protein [Thermosinus carboxydivorans Nor1]|uniref:Type II and III secretion system protein n=1 Tax=Thermosinus carboxydivorans Nor1 TaxID=401526 RepID=A1HM79_9FIRM|nr:secretin N-terminal domain-containing protein [Thermosinus carboxydivorans]EAX48927.1 type II and III secretion system protein [Thermosinus carboxydivorans Nor1]